METLMITLVSAITLLVSVIFTLVSFDAFDDSHMTLGTLYLILAFTSFFCAVTLISNL